MAHHLCDSTLRLIGDVHGLYREFLPLCRDTDHVIQVGDLGLCYADLRRIGIDATRIRVLGGNHDCYDRASPDYFAKQPFFLGDYGLHEFPGVPPIFYVRGAWSIDHAWRRLRHANGGPETWWEGEELGPEELDRAFASMLPPDPRSSSRTRPRWRSCGS